MTNQITRSFPPSTGSCAAVVLANSGPHISEISLRQAFLIFYPYTSSWLPASSRIISFFVTLSVRVMR